MPSRIDTRILHTLFRDDAIPVIAPLGAGDHGETYNINGDTMAGAIAAALKADRLLLLTDVDGVRDASGSVVTSLTADQIRAMTADGTIAGGMIPKTETALAAIEGGVRAVVILDGRAPQRDLAGIVHRARRRVDDPRLSISIEMSQVPGLCRDLMFANRILRGHAPHCTFPRAA